MDREIAGKMDKQELKGKREELAVLMDSRFKKAADSARLEKGRRLESGGGGQDMKKRRED